MTSNCFLAPSPRLGIAFAVMATALAGCSTVKGISPFGSNVPYAQDVQPTIPRPAISEIPAFKAAPPAPKPAAPAAASPPPAPKPPAAEPAPAPPPPPPAAPPPKSSAVEAPAPKIASADNAPASAPSQEQPAVVDTKPTQAASDETVSDKPGKGEGPSIPEERRAFKDDGTYPNLAQVPPRPVNMPTFAEAATLEKSLVADREKAKDASPASPEAPSIDSAPVPVSALEGKAAASAPLPQKVAAVASRTEDSAPCLTAKSVDADPAATIHFDPGSAAMSAGNLARLAEAMPTIRASKGTIRIFGHGDTDTSGAPGVTRFDLAAARAGAVAQAVAGYGIPAARLAVGVACNDAALAGASVQLYAES